MTAQTWTHVGVAQTPGFESVVRHMVEVELFSLARVAESFGVSRERIRQLCKRMGVQTPPRAESLPRVAVMSREPVDYGQRMRAVGEAWFALRDELGYEPTLKQWAERALGVPCTHNNAGPRLLARVGSWNGRMKLVELRQALGIPVPQRGRRWLVSR